MVWKRLFIAAAVAWTIYAWWTHRSVTHGPGVVAPNSPFQANLDHAEPFYHGDYKVVPLARFELEARVLSTKHYKQGRESELCPVDLALGWGPMSDERVLDRLSISQSGRFYHWWSDELPLPEGRITVFSANMHMIPSRPDVAKGLKKIRKGEIVNLKGYLVNVEAKDGWFWRSSLTRQDAGAGACELVWVDQLSKSH